QDGKLIGAVLYGDSSDGAELFATIKSGESIIGREKELLLGFSTDGLGGSNGNSRLEAMSADTSICGCNGVSKGAIIDAIQNIVFNSVAPHKACPMSSHSCRGCMT